MSNEKLNYFTTIKFLSKYILKYKKNFIMFYIGWFINMILTIIIPIIFSIIINEIIYYQNTEVFVKLSIIFVSILIFSCLLYFLIYAQHHYLMNMYTFDIKMDIFKHFQKGDPQYLNNKSTGDIITIIQKYSVECMNFVVRNIIHTSNHIITTIIVIIYLYIINWKVGTLAVFAAPISVFVSIQFGKKIRINSDEQKTYYGSYISWIYEILSGLRDIRMLGAEKKINNNFKNNHKVMFNLDIKLGISSLTAINVIEFTNLIIQLIIFALIGHEALNNNITVGSLTVITSFFGMLVDKIKILSESYLNAQTRISSIQYIYDFLNSPTEDFQNAKKALKINNGEISFYNINFSYDDNPKNILENFSLNIKKNETIALVGKNGSGKTTLAYMLVGFYQPQNGYIEIDGQNIHDCSLKSLRENIGIIQQDVLIFNGTIKYNILLENINAKNDEIIAACKYAGIWDFICTLPNNFDTIIGKGGIEISKGQKQRIAIARIYLKNPKIIIFDESTSNLDRETEDEIHKSFKNILENKTSIVITHRISSVMLCDKVVIIDNGKICELNTPLNMVNKSNKFNELFGIKENSI